MRRKAMRVREILAIEPDTSGWRNLPCGGRVHESAQIDTLVEISTRAEIGADAEISPWAMISEGAKIGARAMIGTWAMIGEEAVIGEWAQIGADAEISARAVIGVDAKIRTRAVIGAGARIGAGAQIGADAKIGAGESTEQLNRYFIACLPEEGIYWKWVTKDRMSPNFDGGTPLEYRDGEIVREPATKMSDQQCAVGLHVLRRGYRPEWIGLCDPGHDLIPLDVLVRRDDVAFGGIPTMDIKLRVWELHVVGEAQIPEPVAAWGKSLD